MIKIMNFGENINRFSFLSNIKYFSIKQETCWERVLILIEKYKNDIIIFNSSFIELNSCIDDLANRSFKGIVFSTIKIKNKRVKSVYLDNLNNEQIVQIIFMQLLKKDNNGYKSLCYNTNTIPLVGHSCKMEAIRTSILKYAPTKEPILILGETGTGKNIVATSIHNISKRFGQFIELNCSALSENLFESELFGHTKGSFTGATCNKKGFLSCANKGTMFLDEIGDIPINSQPKLLKVIEEQVYYCVGDTESKNIDIRFISATNKNLINSIETNCFRKDLFYRISSLIIRLPPLRDHKEDIPELANYYFHNNYPQYSLTQTSINILQEPTWPGNVRELFSFLSRYVICFPNAKQISLTKNIFNELYLSTSIL